MRAIPGTRASASDRARDREHEVAEQAAEEDRDERVREGERGHERGARDDDEQRHPEVAPEEPCVERSEDAQPLRDRLDPQLPSILSREATRG